MNKQSNSLEKFAPHGATHYEVAGNFRKAGYMRLNQEGVWGFWAEGSECWCEDHQLNKGYSNTNKFIKLHVSVS